MVAKKSKLFGLHKFEHIQSYLTWLKKRSGWSAVEAPDGQNWRYQLGVIHDVFDIYKERLGVVKFVLMFCMFI